MKRVYVAIGVLVMIGFGALSWWSRTEAGREWFVVGPARDAQSPYFSHAFEVAPAMAKTAITDQWECTFDIQFLSPAYADVTGDTHLDVWCDLAGLVGVELHYIETFDDSGVWTNRFSVLAVVGGFGEIGDYATFTVPADGSINTVSASLAVDAELRCTTDTNPIGADKSYATHSKEQEAGDAWHVPDGQVGYATIGAAEHSAALSEDVHPDTERFVWQANFCLPSETGDVLRIANIEFNGGGIDASELGPTALEPGVGTGDGEVWVSGSGSTVRYYFEDATSAWFGVGEEAHAARHYTFTGLDVKTMDGTSLSTLLVHCPAVQVYNATAAEWQHVVQSIADWQAAEYTDTWGRYSWDSTPPPDGAVRLLADVYFYIDRDAGRATA